jgi:hypothetical protein
MSGVPASSGMLMNHDDGNRRAQAGPLGAKSVSMCAANACSRLPARCPTARSAEAYHRDSQRSGADGRFLRVEVPDAYLRIAVDIYGPQIRAKQVVWQDDRGKWPWEPGHRGGRGGQPILGVPERVDG